MSACLIIFFPCSVYSSTISEYKLWYSGIHGWWGYKTELESTYKVPQQVIVKKANELWKWYGNPQQLMRGHEMDSSFYVSVNADRFMPECLLNVFPWPTRSDKWMLPWQKHFCNRKSLIGILNIEKIPMGHHFPTKKLNPFRRNRSHHQKFTIVRLSFLAT